MGETFHKNIGECCYLNDWIDYFFEFDFVTSPLFPLSLTTAFTQTNKQ